MRLSLVGNRDLELVSRLMLLEVMEMGHSESENYE